MAAFNFSKIPIKKVREMLTALFDVETGHSHDGTDSRLVTVGTVANGAITTAKLGAKAVTTAKIDDGAVTAGQLAADAVETAKIKDANVTPAKLSAAAGSRFLVCRIEAPGVGEDISGRAILTAPAGIEINIEKAYIIPDGDAVGIDDANTCVINLSDGTNTIVEKTYKTDPAFPANKAVADLGEVDDDHKKLTPGETLHLTMTNGATANPPSYLLQVVYTVADAA